MPVDSVLDPEEEEEEEEEEVKSLCLYF